MIDSRQQERQTIHRNIYVVVRPNLIWRGGSLSPRCNHIIRDKTGQIG